MNYNLADTRDRIALAGAVAACRGAEIMPFVQAFILADNEVKDGDWLNEPEAEDAEGRYLQAERRIAAGVLVHLLNQAAKVADRIEAGSIPSLTDAVAGVVTQALDVYWGRILH
ncbi:hypothetical protein RM190_00590 [Paracoccus sp. CPCC 101403]|uniref:Uncharacterized protein n=1 Tax=Paracoccus broussonetiae TaxID=3075834 RepID=A0ABU3E7Y6_9RHOB|nr:hypothetical protein [Paracoccus sp. CPCC 101403]MDT1060330.1 hypothetical protein [Paracoccus sp. CPCC 101403]